MRTSNSLTSDCCVFSNRHIVAHPELSLECSAQRPRRLLVQEVLRPLAGVVDGKESDISKRIILWNPTVVLQILLKNINTLTRMAMGPLQRISRVVSNKL